MTDNFRIALIHATRVAMEPVESAARELWPEVETVSILEEGLAMDRAAGVVPMSAFNARIVELTRYAEGLNPHGILFTCSAFGEGIEQAAASSRLPVHKPNEAMFDEVLGYGGQVAMIYTFPPSVGGMEKEFREAADRVGSKATLRSVFAEGALDALKSGDAAAHNKIIADAAVAVEDVDAIMLAQFSMAEAAAEIRESVSTPVLTSPESAINKMKGCVVVS